MASGPMQDDALKHVRRIMVERLWFPRFCGSTDGRQRWVVYSWYGACNLRDTTAVSLTAAPSERPEPFDDPITALIETDRWYREVIEPRLQARPPGSSPEG